jgi:hypothetical protein
MQKLYSRARMSIRGPHLIPAMHEVTTQRVTTSICQYKGRFKILNSLGGTKEHIVMGQSVSEVISRLDSLLLVLKSCQKTNCISPQTEMCKAYGML